MENIKPWILSVKLKKKISESLQEGSYQVLKFLQDKNGYLVGGCIRDHFLGRAIKDIDILLIEKEDRISKYFLENGFTRIVLSKKEPVVRYLKQSMTYDFTFVPISFDNINTFLNNLKTRDFTVNSLAVPLCDFDSNRITILDPTGGFSDLKAGKIRCFNPDNLISDPLRMLRAFRLKCLLSYEIDENTLEMIKNNSLLINKVSLERIRDELYAIMESESYVTFNQLLEIGLLGEIFPKLSHGKDMYQGPYHESDVLTHSLNTLKELEILLRSESLEWLTNDIKNRMIANRSYTFLLKLTALLHDIGKPVCVKYQEGRVVFTGHDKVGGELVFEVGLRLKLSKKESNIMKKLVDNHLRLGYLANLQFVSEKAKRRLVNILGEELGGAVLLFLADALATRKEAKMYLSNYIKLGEELLRMKESQAEVKESLLNGNEIMDILSLKPGKEVGILKAFLKKAEEEGLVRNKKQAKDFLIRMIKKEAE